MRKTIDDALTRLIATQARVDPSLVVPEAVLSELGVTSLNLVEIITTIEDEYDVTIPVDAVEAWNNYKTVADLLELARSLGLAERDREP